MLSLEIHAMVAREHQRELLAEAARARMVAAAYPRQAALPRRAALPLGRLLIQTGAWLLRYGRAEGAMELTS